MSKKLNLPVISADRIVDMAQKPNMLLAGMDYAQHDRVIDVEYDEELEVFTAFVEGSKNNIYCVTLSVEDDGSIDGDCTCPVSYGCKHCIAVAFVIMGLPQSKPRLIIKADAPNKSIASGELGLWFAKIETEAMHLSLAKDSVRFVIEPKRAFKAPKSPKKMQDPLQNRVLITTRAYRQQRNDSGKWSPLSTWELQGNNLNVTPAIKRLLARMMPDSMGGDFSSEKVPQGHHGWEWLQDAAALGLLYWKKPEGNQVSIETDPLNATFAWRLTSNGNHYLDLEGLSQGTLVTASAPPLAINEDLFSIALINTGLDQARAGMLLSMPPITETDVPLLAARWKDLAGDEIAAPPSQSTDDIEADPRPILRFVVDKIEQRDDSYSYYRTTWRKSSSKIARLSFDYAGYRLPAPAPTQAEIVHDGHKFVRVMRNIAAEQAAADRLADLELVPLALTETVRLKPEQGWDLALSKESGSYPQFLANAVATLEAEGWLIEYAPDWPHKLVARDDNELGLTLNPAQPESSGNELDWFDLALPARVAGMQVDILPALRHILAEGGEDLLNFSDDYLIALPLDNQKFTTVELGELRPLLSALLRLALTQRSSTDLRLNRYDMGTIHDLACDGVNWTSASALRQLAKTLHDPANANYTPPAGLAADLRPYQRNGAAWLQALHAAGLGGILADDMGLGKTLQAIAHLLSLGSTPTLVVAPTSVLPNWQAEISRFAPTLRCHTWHGLNRHDTAAAMADADVVITSYPLLAKDKDLLGSTQWAALILDEAHVLKNPATAGFKAAAVLQAKQVIALTGTPVENRLNDIWALASLTNPGLLGTFEKFRQAYRTPIEKHGDSAAKAALARRLRPFMLRRTKDEVASELPSKTHISGRIELGDAQMRLYESQRLLMNGRVREEIARVGLMRAQIIVLDAMLKLRQICCDPSLLPNGAGNGIKSAKRARLMEMVPELIDEGRRIIIFSQFTTMLDLISNDLSEAGYAHEQLRGSTRNRAEPVRRFQEGEVPLILVSLKAGGAGINLTAADTVILYDPWWNPAVEAQAIDRAHRLGQTRPVFVHRLIAAGTIEEKIIALQERKQDLANLLWSEEGNSGGGALSDDDIEFLLG